MGPGARSQISALDAGTGELETVSPQGAGLVAPDDLDFDAAGNLYVTEYYDGRVSVRGTDGRTRVLAENLPMPNALAAGPDGKLYYPVLGTNDIWRIDPDGGEPERVAGDLGVPDAVKFDADGFIVSTQVGTGEVLRIDPRSGDRTVLATIAPGLDNLTFAGDRLFVSSFTGRVTEILGGGETRDVLPGGLTCAWPSAPNWASRSTSVGGGTGPRTRRTAPGSSSSRIRPPSA
jgi:sugar lactone lactonase YvrE